MRIGVLKCGPMNPGLVGKWGEYPRMYGEMLRPHAPEIEIVGVDVDGGQALGAPRDLDGWLISGSKHGVYDGLDWIEPLKAFLRDAVDQEVPVVGICFGHQVLAEAMGGRVIKYPDGWAVGATDYQATSNPAWAAPLGAHWAGFAVHQDQVVEVPRDATVIATSDFCANAALAYGDPSAPAAISVQPHPEFDATFVGELIDIRLADIVPEDIIARARATLDTPVNNTDWARIIVDYFKIKNAGV